MRTFVLLINFSLFIISGLAQQKELDSLLNELKKNTKEDTVRLNLLNTIAYNYYNTNPDAGLATAEQALQLAKKLNSKAGIAEAHKAKGINNWANGEDSMALTNFATSLNIYQQLDKKKEIAKVYNNMGMAYNDLPDYALAIEYQNKALAIFISLNDTTKTAQVLNGIGISFLYLSDYPKALEYYFRSLKLFESVHEKKYIANVLTNIGIVYRHLENYKKALQYNFQALEVYEQSGNEKGIAGTLGNIGNIYDDIDSSSKALEYYKKALVISKRLKNKSSIASNMSNIGVVYNGLSNYAKALEYLQPSLLLYTQLNDKNNLSLMYNEIGKAYCFASPAILKQYGIAADKRFVEAINYHEKGLSLAHDIGALARENASWESLSATYEMQQDFKKALYAYKQAVLLKDSMYNDEKKDEVTRLEMQYEFEKKEALDKAGNEKRQALASAEIKRQKIINNASVGIASLLFIALIVSFIFYKKRKDAEAKRKEAELITQVAEIEMKALRAQMNPHFIFNSLNSINDYIDKHNITTATLYTTKFAKLMRMILENSEHKEITLADELKALELYIQLEALRMKDKFSYEIKVDDDIDAEATLIPPLLLQPFVENSLWHGISKKKGLGKILIHISKEGGMIRCVVEDNGVGRQNAEALEPAFKQNEKKSLGMKITKARIDIMNKMKNSKGSIVLSNLAEGTRAEVNLPLELNF